MDGFSPVIDISSMMLRTNLPKSESSTSPFVEARGYLIRSSSFRIFALSFRVDNGIP